MRISKLSNRPFIQNIIIMASGTASAQAITMFFSPIITRIYGPEAFGILGVFSAIVGVIAPVSSLTYPVAVVLPKSDRDAKGIMLLSIVISITFTILIGLAILLFNNELINLLKIDTIGPYLILLPFVILFSGVLQTIEQWFIRMKYFSITAKVTFMQSLVLQISKVGIGYFYPFGVVLIIISTLSHAIKAVMLFLGIKESKRVLLTEILDTRFMLKRLAKEYKDFPKYRAPEVFINAISSSLPILLLTSFFGPVAAGFYTLCKTVLGIPSQLIGKAVGDVFYPKISEYFNEERDVTNLIKKATFSLVGLGALPFSIIIIFGPDIFGIIFGDDWREAGEYARWISLWSFSTFVNKPCIKALPVLSAQNIHLNFTILILVGRVFGLIAGYYLFSSDLVAVALFSIMGAILNILLIIFTITKTAKNA